MLQTGRFVRARIRARREGAGLAAKTGASKINDTNYIFLTFVTRYLPAGLVGLVSFTQAPPVSP